MRERSKCSPAQRIQSSWGYNDPYYHEGGKTWFVYPYVSLLYDYNNGTSRPDSPCFHLKVSTTNTDISLDSFPSNQDPGKDKYIFSGEFVSQNDVFAAIRYLLPWHLHGDITFSDVEDQIKGPKQDLALFVGELMELPALVSVPKRVADGYLQYKFGLESSANGFRSLAESLASLGSDWEILQSKAKEPQEANFSRNSSAKINVPMGGYFSGWVLEGELKCTTKWGFLVNFQLPKTGIPHLDYIGEKLGIELNPSTFWQLVPLSFVVDWFLPVGQFLKQFDHNSFRLKIVQLRGWKTVRFKGQLKVRCVEDRYSENDALVGKVHYTMDIDAFSREPVGLVDKKFNGLLPSVKLNPGKLASLAALGDAMGSITPTFRDAKDAGAGALKKLRR